MTMLDGMTRTIELISTCVSLIEESLGVGVWEVWCRWLQVFRRKKVVEVYKRALVVTKLERSLYGVMVANLVAQLVMTWHRCLAYVSKQGLKVHFDRNLFPGLKYRL